MDLRILQSEELCRKFTKRAWTIIFGYGANVKIKPKTVVKICKIAEREFLSYLKNSRTIHNGVIIGRKYFIHFIYKLAG